MEVILPLTGTYRSFGIALQRPLSYWGGKELPLSWFRFLKYDENPLN
jgi:hypothetical protein